MHNTIEMSAHDYVFLCKHKIDFLSKEQDKIFSDMKEINFTAIDFFLSVLSPRRRLFNSLRKKVELTNYFITKIGDSIISLQKNKKDRIDIDLEYLSFLKDI